MKKKYQITLVVIGCLIALIGLSYAYFLATSKTEGNGGSVTVQTVTLDNVGFNIEGMLEFNDLDIYPGHKNISKIKVTALGNNDTINYKLVWEGINTINTPLKYYVYKTTTNEDPTIACNKQREIQGASTIYYETCTENNFNSLGTIINEGEITKTEEIKEFTLIQDEVIKGTEEGNVVYYYVVLEYPNLDESQNIDMGGKFEGKVTVKKNNSTELADVYIKKMYKEIENGYEEITTMPSEGYIINEEKSTCTNNAIPELNNNKILVTNLNISGTECYLYFDVIKDTEKPIISNITTRTTKTEIVVTVTATDNKDVTEYWYQLDSGTPVKSTENNYKFTGLTIEATYSVKVYVKDAAGNQSDIVTKEVTIITSEVTLAKLGITNYNTTSPDFNQLATTDEEVYATNDEIYNGTTYYWRGAATTNYVKFAGYCWRAIRINGDGSIRLIYDGTTCHSNGTRTTNSIAKANIRYNIQADKSEYVGWSYTLGYQRSLNGTDSNIKTETELWYSNNIGNNENYNSLVAEGKFCNDRDIQQDAVFADVEYYYNTFDRIFNNHKPSFECNSNDIYELKAGAITADETAFAGGVYAQTNTSYYLYNGQGYWTMSPRGWWGSNAKVYIIDTNGKIANSSNVSIQLGIRPVINLKSNLEFIGKGTKDEPFEVKGVE